MIPSFVETDCPDVWKFLVTDNNLLKHVSGGNLTSAQLKAIKKYGGMEQKDLEAALNANNKPYLDIALLIDNVIWIDSSGRIQITDAAVNSFETNAWDRSVFGRFILTAIVLWGSMETKPEKPQSNVRHQEGGKSLHGGCLWGGDLYRGHALNGTATAGFHVAVAAANRRRSAVGLDIKQFERAVWHAIATPKPPWRQAPQTRMQNRLPNSETHCRIIAEKNRCAVRFLRTLA